MKKSWQKIKKYLIGLPYSEAKIHAELGNAKHISLNNDYADLLITSPPYINVFNYHQKYRRSVEELGFNVLNIAKGEIGSNRKK